MNFLYLAFSLINDNQTQNLPKVSVNDTQGKLATILTLTFVILGAISLMMLVIAGFRYTISGGDPQKVADTKRAIIYTLVGVVIAATAAIIVNAVLGQTSQGK